MEWWREPVVQTLLMAAAVLLAAVVGGIVGFLGGRRTAAEDRRARRTDAETARIIELIEATRDFYVQFLDWHARWLNMSPPGVLNQPPNRPRFADRPAANLAWLADPSLASDIDVYVAHARERARAGVHLQRDMTERHLDLVDRTVRAAERQIIALRAGQGTIPTEEQLSERLRAERVEELKREDPTRA